MADPSTIHYGWVKPTVGSDADTWGGLINADLDGIDATVGVQATSLSTVASIIAIAGAELINLSDSLAGVSSSLGGVSTSAVNASASQVAISASLASTAATGAAVSGSVAAIGASLGAVSASLAGVSASLSATASMGAVVSSSLVGVSSSLAVAANSLGSAVSGVSANAIGYLGIPLSTRSGAYTPVLADAGKHFFFTANATAQIPANASVAYQVGTFLKFSADVGVSLAVAITSDTLRYPATGGTGSRTVTGPGFIVVEKQKSGEWWVVGGQSVS